ncbi:hypothetical protein [Pseudomonas marginalis]|uniref:hypothetical protein n=1 Tax=Pseudomonas marginalis TaxID=298 RepID=UPI002A36FA03|nr:hypothetical protein [Pseudomonas marginalis]WPN25350.1 hypothetical protein QMK57_08305 [Pseudomonas marginalis]
MSDLYDFEVSLAASSEAEPAQVVVFFTGPDAITDIQVTDALQKRLPGYILPDHLIFLIPQCFEEQIQKQCQDKASPLSSALQRRNANSSLSYGFAYHDGHGSITKYQNISGAPKNISKLLQNGTAKIVRAGMEKLVKCTSVLTKAPAGFLFSKPSSRSANYFIRAENLLSETLHAHFLAFASLKMLKQAATSTLGEPDTIYLDTMAFLPIALSMQLYQARFGKPTIQTIRSFHSHEGLKDGRLPGANAALCLISASSTCGLADQWIRVNSAPPSRVATVLSFSKKSESCTIVHTLERPQDFEMLAESETSEARQTIRIHGERFIAEHTETRLLNISMDHLPDDLQVKFDSFIGKGLFRCVTPIQGGERRRTVHVDKKKLVETDGFKTWFKKCLDQESPASTKLIIHDRDSASEKLATEALEYLTERGLTCTKISEEDFNQDEELHGSVIVVAAAAERGTILQRVSRRLRSAQKSGTRLYIVGALFGRTYELMKDLSSNLTQPPKGERRYVFKAFMEIPAGSAVCSNHWAKEKDIINKLVAFGDESLLLIKHRADQLAAEEASGLSSQAFWPSSFTNEEMKLTDGFAFVNGKEDVKKASTVDIFLTILWILQNAREGAKIKDAKRLESGELQQVLLSPDVFSRYDDGIIQSAFLRAALPTELDYSAHEIYSAAMADIILRVAKGYSYERGEAAMEFIIALAIEKIRLHKEVDKKLRATLKATLGTKIADLSLLLDGDPSPF